MKRFETIDKMLQDFYMYSNKEKPLEYKILFQEDDEGHDGVHIIKKWNSKSNDWDYILHESFVMFCFYKEKDIEFAIYDLEGISPLYFTHRKTFKIKKVTI